MNLINELASELFSQSDATRLRMASGEWLSLRRLMIERSRVIAARNTVQILEHSPMNRRINIEEFSSPETNKTQLDRSMC